MANESKASDARGRRGKIGTVSSISGEKTIHVIINNLVKHPMYGKYIRRRTKLAVHDPQSAAKLGDVVEIVPCRRISKSKSWRLGRIVRQSEGPMPAVADVGKEG